MIVSWNDRINNKRTTYYCLEVKLKFGIGFVETDAKVCPAVAANEGQSKQLLLIPNSLCSF